MSTVTTSSDFPYLNGDGEMSTLIRQYDWSATPLGHPSTWPQSFRTTLSIVIHAKFPMFLFWGAEMRCFYNDAYVPSITGSGKHPHMLGMPAKNIWQHRWRIIEKNISQVMSGGEATWSEDELIPIYRNNQSENSWWTYSYSAVYDEANNIAGVLVTCTETTRKVQNFMNLESSRQQFANLVKSTSVGIIVLTGEEMMVQIVNEAYSKIIGRTVEELSGKRLFDIIPEAAPEFKYYIDKVRVSGEPVYLYDHPYFVNVDGMQKVGFLNIIYQPYKDADDVITGTIALCHDVSEQVEGKRKLLEAEERTRVAVDAAELGMYEIDRLTGEVVVTPRFNEIFDVPATSIHNEYISRIHPEDVYIRERAHNDAYQNGHLFYEARIVKRNGAIHWIKVKGKVFYNEQATPMKLIGVVQDITDQKEMERQKDNFLGIASHELKTPVTSIKGYAQLMEKVFRRNGDIKSAEMAAKMNVQANRLQNLIYDLLDVTKINNGKLQFNYTTFHFTEMVNSVVADLQFLISSHVIEKQLHYTGMVHADYDRLAQVLINLITNALKYSPDADKIIVYTLQKDDQVQLCVQDFGIGISPEKQGQVFEQFYRVSGTKEHTFPGLGLGLYISSEILKRMNGRIWVNSIEGKGSTFCFSIPIVQATNGAA